MLWDNGDYEECGGDSDGEVDGGGGEEETKKRRWKRKKEKEEEVEG